MQPDPNTIQHIPHVYSFMYKSTFSSDDISISIDQRMLNAHLYGVFSILMLFKCTFHPRWRVSQRHQKSEKNWHTQGK